MSSFGGLMRRLSAPVHRLFSASHSDVDASVTPANGNVPTYNATTGKWEPQAPSGGGGGDEITDGIGTLGFDGSGGLTRTGPGTGYFEVRDDGAVFLQGGPTGSGGLSLSAAGTLRLSPDGGAVDLTNWPTTDPVGNSNYAWVLEGVLARAGTARTRLPAKAAVRAATTANGTLASDFENGDTIDGVTLATGDRILLKDQTAGAENGLYTINASGAPTRTTDADSAAEVFQGFLVFVREGTTNANRVYVHTTAGTITLGTTALTFAQLGGAGGGSMSSFTLAGDGGSSQTIGDGNTLTVAGGAGLASTAGATDTVTVDLDINSLTADGSPDGAADYVATYDASAGTHKKVLLDDLPGGGGGGTGTTAVLLDYALASNLAAPLTLTANTWTDIIANQSFTVGATTSNIEVAVSGYLAVVGTDGSQWQCALRLVIDSAGTPVNKMLSGQTTMTNSPGYAVNPLAGAGLVSLGSLSAAAHTVKLQGYSAGANASLYCRPATFPNGENFQMRVFERK